MDEGTASRTARRLEYQRIAHCIVDRFRHSGV